MGSDESRGENDEAEVEKLLETAQLKKLDLEISALERKKREEEETEGPRQQKLNLELKTLLWQTGRIYRLNQFAVIVSVLATTATIFATTYGIWSSYKKDIQNKEKEIRERTDSLYRTELQKLIQYPIDSKITVSEAVFLFRDLEDVVRNSYEKGEKQDRQKEEIGFLMAQLMTSPDFDLSVTRNIEFDRKALRNSGFYRDYLIQKPEYNRDILSKYKAVLAALREEDPNYSILPDEKVSELFTEDDASGKKTGNQAKFFQYVYIFYAYQSHVELLMETSKDPAKAKDAEFYLGLSFCWFYDATRNQALTARIYGGNADMIAWRWQQCGQGE